jgi:O-methyltransferase involved in polyketide biosynthesis
MEPEKVRLTKERETYLPTLYGKALDSHVENPILGDTFAADVIQRIDFDFKKLKLAKGGEVTLPMRARQLDGWTRDFLSAHPSATVLNLGCGLDSRVFRIDPPASVRWYDVDLPDVIELRKRLYPGRRDDYAMLATSVTEPGWLDGIPGDRPVMVVAEGLVQYLTEEGAAALFNRITQKFPSGRIIFDAYSGLMTGFINLAIKTTSMFSKLNTADTQVHLTWGVDDPHIFEQKVARLKLISVVSFLTMPELVERLSVYPNQRVSFRFLGKRAWYQKAIQHMCYEF